MENTVNYSVNIVEEWENWNKFDDINAGTNKKAQNCLSRLYVPIRRITFSIKTDKTHIYAENCQKSKHILNISP